MSGTSPVQGCLAPSGHPARDGHGQAGQGPGAVEGGGGSAQHRGEGGGAGEATGGGAGEVCKERVLPVLLAVLLQALQRAEEACRRAREEGGERMRQQREGRKQRQQDQLNRCCWLRPSLLTPPLTASPPLGRRKSACGGRGRWLHRQRQRDGEQGLP